jgi:GDP-4-dehydro-6-deoxy-D-mannose reductase
MPGEDLLRETGPFRSTNPYALSKTAVELLGKMYHETFGLDVLSVIPFYVLGPRKEPDAPSDFAKAIASFRRGKVKELTVGNLDVVRDVVDIRDAVKGLSLLVEKGQPGVSYNLCTGKGTTLRQILEGLLKISRSKLPIVQDPDKLRLGENQRIVGDPSRLKSLGWAPTVKMEDTLKSILDYWESYPWEIKREIRKCFSPL